MYFTQHFLGPNDGPYASFDEGVLWLFFFLNPRKIPDSGMNRCWQGKLVLINLGAEDGSAFRLKVNYGKPQNQWVEQSQHVCTFWNEMQLTDIFTFYLDFFFSVLLLPLNKCSYWNQSCRKIKVEAYSLNKCYL